MMADDAPSNATETTEGSGEQAAATTPEAPSNEAPTPETPAKDTPTPTPAAPAKEAAATEEAPAATKESPAATEEAPAPTKEPPAATEEAPDATEETPAKSAPAAEEKPEPEPVPDPETCKALAIGLDALWEGVLSGEWDDTDFEYYLEPAGVLHGPLVCTSAAEDQPQKAGLLMTRAGWKAKTVFLDDGVNPETYELSFPKEFGYVKPLAHYKPSAREHAKFPWSKKY